MKIIASLLGLILVVLGILAAFALFTVDQRQAAIVLQFGDPKRIITEPGLHYKTPFVQNVLYFDKRILDLDAAPQEVIAADRNRLVVDAFVRYRIKNVLLFYQRVRNLETARNQLASILESALRQVLGRAQFQEIVGKERSRLMLNLTKQVDADARSLGLEVIDVRIKRADLPEANSKAIYARMQTERKQEAEKIRAIGRKRALKIRAEAEEKVTVMKANATRDGQKIRGNGDAVRNSIFAKAFGKDPDFFAFYRAMQAYEKGLNPQDTRMVLSPDSEFFRYFNNPRNPAANSTNR